MALQALFCKGLFSLLKIFYKPLKFNEFFIDKRDVQNMVPLRVYLQGDCFERMHTLSASGTYGELHVYSSKRRRSDGAMICVKLINEEALRNDDCTDVDVNNGLGEIESYKWLGEFDPKEELFAIRYAPHRNSIIGCTGDGHPLYCLRDIKIACCDSAVDKIVHYTVMHCYEGNLFSLFSN
jgi:hypothetical protein